MKSLPRHEAIQPLSRHHHHALVMAMKIRKIVTDEVTLDQVEELRKELKQFWEADGQAHFREEEEILLPAYARFASPRHEEIIEMLLEHVKIRSLVAAIETGEGELPALMRQLSEELERHVRREERVIFPMIEAALPELELRKLAPYFHEYHQGTRCEKQM